jgi:hypothetical protein
MVHEHTECTPGDFNRTGDDDPIRLVQKELSNIPRRSGEHQRIVLARQFSVI